MTFHLLIGESGALLGASSARIAAGDRQAFEDAHALLARAYATAGDMDAQVQAARDEGHRQGLQEASEQAAGHIAAHVAQLAAGLADEAQRRRAEIAQAAFAGARAILGTLDQEEAAVRLAINALARTPADERVVIACSPDVADRLRAALATREGVTVEARDGMAPLGVEVLTGTGRLVAGPNVQLSSLAERWGVTA